MTLSLSLKEKLPLILFYSLQREIVASFYVINSRSSYTGPLEPSANDHHHCAIPSDSALWTVNNNIKKKLKLSIIVFDMYNYFSYPQVYCCFKKIICSTSFLCETGEKGFVQYILGLKIKVWNCTYGLHISKLLSVIMTYDLESAFHIF